MRLGKSAYLGGPDYTIADIATFPWTVNHDRQGVSWKDHPNLARWFESVAARPAVRCATGTADAIRSARGNAKPDDLDRFFGRGRYART